MPRKTHAAAALDGSMSSRCFNEAAARCRGKRMTQHQGVMYGASGTLQ